MPDPNIDPNPNLGQEGVYSMVAYVDFRVTDFWLISSIILAK